MEIESKETTPTTTDMEKRKSVSFVDEKLIDNAIKSTTTATIDSNDSNGSPSSSSSSKWKSTTTTTSKRHNYNNHSNSNHHPRQNNGQSKNYYNGGKFGHHHHHHGNKQQQTSSGHYHQQQLKSNSTQSSSNPVIIYYSNPDVEINVNDLIEKCQAQQQQQQHSETDNNNGQNMKHHHPAKHLLSNSNHHHHQNGRQNNYHHHHNGGGHYKPGSSTSKQQHHHHHNQQRSSNDNNWRNQQHHHNNKKSNAMKNDYHDYRSNSNSNDEQTDKNNKTSTATTANGTSSSEPITIYYNDSNVSLDENLKFLKETLSKEKNDSKTDSSQPQQQQKPLEKESINDTVIKTDDTTTTNTYVTGHEEQESEIMSKTSEEILPPPKITESNSNISTLVISNDPEDVISGGTPIENPRSPAADANVDLKMVRCTIISHPGHFYVKFINTDHENKLNAMNQFYSQDEHIELTLDVLQPEQYYAALRTNDEGWIRIKLLQTESVHQITCFLIDQGCVDILRLNQLQPLYSQFRSVPRQSIRVSLSGIRPRESDDWLPNEALEFKKLLDNQTLKVDFIGNDNGEAKWGQIVEPDSQLQICLKFNEDHDDSKLAGRSVADVLIERNLAIAAN
ncbi:uncharacterized protein LOC124497685 [Dermatophagoides farinae]|uniref:uncharacterized protein LOC124497685 n=1 Tax=Dermatophagoides farinae TaxID=6954 RepID=UPI003F62B709